MAVHARELASRCGVVAVRVEAIRVLDSVQPRPRQEVRSAGAAPKFVAPFVLSAPIVDVSACAARSHWRRAGPTSGVDGGLALVAASANLSLSLRRKMSWREVVELVELGTGPGYGTRRHGPRRAQRRGRGAHLTIVGAAPIAPGVNPEERRGLSSHVVGAPHAAEKAPPIGATGMQDGRLPAVARTNPPVGFSAGGHLRPIPGQSPLGPLRRGTGPVPAGSSMRPRRRSPRTAGRARWLSTHRSA